MSYLDDDDTFTELADEERRREERKSSSIPYLRFGLILLAVVAVVLLGVFFFRSYLHNREVASYEEYVAQVSDIISQSDKMGAELRKLLTNPGDTSRKDVQTKLDRYIQTSDKLTEQATALKAPQDLQEAQKWFAATMELRSQGLTDLKPSLMNALEVRDLDVASEQITRAMQLLLLSDVAYDTFFVRQASEVLKQRNIAQLTVPASGFLDNADLASKSTIKDLLSTLKSSENLQSVHGVALTKLTAMPGEKSLEEGSTYNLQASDKLAFVATVENQGNMAEKDVPVTLKLSSQTRTQPQIITVKIPEIKPKETKTVELKGVNPTEYGEDALLRVEVGPVPGERNRENNVIEAHVIFVL